MKWCCPWLAWCVISCVMIGCGGREVSAPAVVEVEVDEATAPPASTTVTHLEARDAAELLKSDENVAVLDVRTPEEYAEGHIDGAINIDFRADDFSDQVRQLDRETPYVVHCRSGGRSTASLDILQDLGFRRIYHLDEGINGWLEAELPLEK